MGSPTEMLSRRCVQLLKKVLSPDVWPSVELRLSPWMEKLLLTVEQQQPNFTNICTALELLSFLLVLMVSNKCIVFAV
jgi:transformation/transcription domain-associated protein